LEDLVADLAPKGGEMLVQALRDGKFIPPVEAVRENSLHEDIGGRLPRHAKKITDEMAHVGTSLTSAQAVLRGIRAFGSVWSEVFFQDRKGEWKKKRIRWEEFEPTESRESQPSRGSDSLQSNTLSLVINSFTGDVLLHFGNEDMALKCIKCTVDGGEKGKGLSILRKLDKISVQVATKPRPG
jgi:hypothetical protein